jgi:hypothetical protein
MSGRFDVRTSEIEGSAIAARGIMLAEGRIMIIKSVLGMWYKESGPSQAETSMVVVVMRTENSRSEKGLCPSYTTET